MVPLLIWCLMLHFICSNCSINSLNVIWLLLLFVSYVIQLPDFIERNNVVNNQWKLTGYPSTGWIKHRGCNMWIISLSSRSCTWQVRHVFMTVCDRKLSPYSLLEYKFSSKAFSNVHLLAREQVKEYNLVCVSIWTLIKYRFCFFCSTVSFY